MEYSTIVGDPIPDAVATYGTKTWRNNRLLIDIPEGTLAFSPNNVFESYKTPSDKEPFGRIVKSGRIKMTDYIHSKTDITYPLVYLPRHTVKRACVCTTSSQSIDEQKGLYHEVTDFSKLIQNFPVRSFEWADGDLRDTVMKMVVRDSATSLDLLTEYSERAQVLRLLLDVLSSVRRPLQSYKDWKENLLKRKGTGVAEEVANRWLQYRYAIMPLIYTAQDIMTLLDKQDRVFMTERSSLRSVGKFPDPELWRHYDTGSATIQWRAVGKASFTADSSTPILDQIGINPIVTAWELTPFSFVVDWFVDVGSWLEAQTFAFSDFSKERKFCISTKKTLSIRTLFKHQEPEVPAQTIHPGSTDIAPHTFASIPGITETFETRVLNEETYERNVFTPSDITLNLSPYLDWRRYLDGVALGLKPILKSLRRLR